MPSSTLFSSVRVLDRDSEHHGATLDVLLHEGKIFLDSPEVPEHVERVNLPGLCVSPGWVDIGARLSEPGHEERETVASLLAAAQLGGFTRVLAFPDTTPAVDNQSAVLALLERAKKVNGPHLHLIGAISQGRQGKQLAEIGDMVEAGVAMFSDGWRAIDDTKLLQLALIYTQPFGATVLLQPGERRLEGRGHMHEGQVSTVLGLNALPAIAEEIGLQRDLSLLGYRGGKMHLHALTLASSIKNAAFAKTQHPNLTFGISVLHLMFSDKDLYGYDVNMKVLPPLRTELDRQALLEAIQSGEADALVSNHQPQDVESKRVEFPYASFGAATLELAYSIATTASGDGEICADYFARKNRRVAGLPPATIKNGATAELTFFQPQQSFPAPRHCQASLGINQPVFSSPLTGSVVGTYLDGRWNPSLHKSNT